MGINLVFMSTFFKVTCPKDQQTHTGQTWDSEDVRSLRFMNNTKQTNTRWAIDLIAQVPPKIVTKRVVACEGDKNPALGHPKVYINLDTHDPVACIYCGLRYQLKDDHHH
jgi:NADH dehydrogenase (ubiquinone) Fe-S protein 6